MPAVVAEGLADIALDIGSEGAGTVVILVVAFAGVDIDEVVLDGTFHTAQLGEQLLSLYEKPSGTPTTNPEGGKWVTLKEISARLKKVFKSAYTEDDGSYIKIGNFLNRPECKFESDRKSFGMVYWVKER